MSKIKFGDPESIAYAKAKGLAGLEVFYSHECDCEYCREELYECPYCNSHAEPDWEDFKSDTCKCSTCGKQAWRDCVKKNRNDAIIRLFENKTSEV
jgi:hypothetical protein